jgi:hypothetical protein
LRYLLDSCFWSSCFEEKQVGNNIYDIQSKISFQLVNK